MSRVPPSQQIANSIAEFLKDGINSDSDVKGSLLRLGAQRLLQELLEAESEEYLGRGHYERRQDGEEHKGYRNGYAERAVKTAEGKIPVFVPELRATAEPYHSKLMEFLKGHSDVLDQLIVEMYARGLSNRDIEDTFKDIAGECLVSKSSVSRVTEALWQDYEAFCTRDLSEYKVEYLFLDAVYESLRKQMSACEGILCAWGVLRDGHQVLLHMALGNKESYDAWLEFLRHMLRRGLGTPLSITTVGAPGLTRAVDAVWPESMRIRCWAHKIRNILDKVRDEARDEVKAYLYSIRDAANETLGRHASEQFIETYQDTYPSAVRSWKDDLEASLAILKLPPFHRKVVRTTNLIERSFEEERRRTKVIPRFFDEKSCLKLVYATLCRTSQRWKGVKFSKVEQVQIRRLLIAYGIDDQEPISVVAS